MILIAAIYTSLYCLLSTLYPDFALFGFNTACNTVSTFLPFVSLSLFECLTTLVNDHGVAS